MESLILLIVFGLGVAYFATENTATVHILLGNYLLQGIPMYIVVVGSILLGVFISWLVSFVNNFSSYFAIHGKEAALKKSHEEITNLQQEKHDLQLELAHLKGEKHIEEERKEEEPEERVNNSPSLLQHVRHGLGLA